ncbi:OPT oligopeptide transporter [Vararia minispora EC-137]|uniref:OPT oligopeptide transporter n=1 Tax=Vararia minispora EC-137 TaxID=1314806 RepID=A0ACB8QVC4_9AGAM|nr:OPT oligopeptide transporter [Vararia minispora EC-137]
MSETAKTRDSSYDAEKASHEGGKVVAVPELSEDPNFDPSHMQFEDDSPYPEVRSSVSNTDDPSMPVSTFRAWFLGLIWAIVIPGVNQFFSFRFPSVTITTLVPLLLSYPILSFWTRVVPAVKVFGISLNPGPFNVKEHVIVTIMASVASSSAYATGIIAVQIVFYNQNPPFAYQWLLVMSTQLIGFSIGGLCRRFLVAPPSMIWPSNLVSATVFNTLHGHATAGDKARGGISRERFFFYTFCIYFVWNFVPSYLFTALSYFPWVTWIRPNNVTLNQLFGTTHGKSPLSYHLSLAADEIRIGLAMGLITFDWAQISYIGSPLPVPFWAAANIGAAIVLFYWIITPILYYRDRFDFSFLPMVSSHTYDNMAKPYDVSRIVNADGNLDVAAYRNYSPLFIPAAFAMSYGLSFASITATITHALLYYRKQLWTQARRSLSEQPDIHARLMAVYPQVPEWWYASIFVSMFVFGVVVVEVYNTSMPVWAFVLALIISFVYTIPIGIIQAITNQQVGLNVITEFIIGYALPGKPIAMMMFKTWGYITMAQALQFVSDLKLGHYMKIPQRHMFWAQLVATIIAGTTQLGVQSWMFSNIANFCTPGQADGFICPGTTVFGTASIIFGVVGPARIFGTGAPYHPLTYFFLVGVLAPLIQYALHKTFKLNWLKYVNFPVLFTGTGALPPATPLNFVPWVIVCYIFNFVIRRRHFGWWSKYNYVLSAGLDSGFVIGTIIVFFCLQFPRNGTIGESSILSWWGNKGAFETADVAGTPLKAMPSGVPFGPSSWN